MSSVKVAISLDPALLRQADGMARARHASRSRFIAELIGRAAKEAADRAVTEQLDRVYSNPRARSLHRKLARERYQDEAFGDDSVW
jgi:metal-responsive CopG/Arc/MetJ family transcriptional regulator